MEYVYIYMHPQYPYLYIGRTCDLKHRIWCHDNNERDNISREHEKLLNESTVYYVELNSRTESEIAETYLINKHKPLLNKAKKYGESVTDGFVSLPAFKKLDERERKIRRACEDMSYEQEKFKGMSEQLQEWEKANMTADEKLLMLKKRFSQQTDMINVYESVLNKTENNINTFYFTRIEAEWFLKNSGINTEFVGSVIDENSGAQCHLAIQYKEQIFIYGCDFYKQEMQYCSENDAFGMIYFGGMSIGATYKPTNNRVYSLYLPLLKATLRRVVDELDDIENNNSVTLAWLLNHNGELRGDEFKFRLKGDAIDVNVDDGYISQVYNNDKRERIYEAESILDDNRCVTGYDYSIPDKIMDELASFVNEKVYCGLIGDRHDKLNRNKQELEKHIANYHSRTQKTKDSA